MRRAWSHNLHYHDLVLRSVPAACVRALDVGCGEGLLARRLASRCGEVIGIDKDEHVLPRPAEDELENVRFVAGDVLTYPFPAASFDFITAIATLHHLPLEAGLERFRALLKPGGALAVIGLYRPETFVDYFYAAAALPVSWSVRRWRGHAEMRAAMQPPQATLEELRRTAQVWLPGAVLTRRFFFRYSLVWRKPQ